MFERYNKMNEEELNNSLTPLKVKLTFLDDRLKVILKELKKGLAWLFLLPIIGFFIRNNIFFRRKEMDLEYNELLHEKTFIELEIKIIEEKIKNQLK